MKNIRTGFIGVAVLLAATVVASAGDDEIHITNSQTVSNYWNVNDATGHLWDIYTGGGYVNKGTNNAYSASMMLQINNTQMSVPASARLSKDENEIEIGPWKCGEVNVYRRIYIDKNQSYVRWIDIFENTSDSPQKLDVRVRYNMGSSTKQIYTTLGQQLVTSKDWGLITITDEKSGQPDIVHFFAAKNTKFRPTLQVNLGSNTHWCIFSVDIPAKKTAALCFFEAQLNSDAEARKFMENFNLTRELNKIPPALKRIILNMGNSMLALGSLELPRKENTDLVILRNSNELTGTIINDKFSLDTPFGKLELPADQVIGFQSALSSKDFVQAALVDGQIISGKLSSGPIKIKLSDGNEIPVSPGKFATATFAISEKRPQKITVAEKPLILLRSGQQLFFDTTGMDYVFQTEHGELKLSPDHLRAIHLTGHDGSMHIAEFANGTMLSGLLTAEKLKLKLELGLTMEISRQSVAKFIFPKKAVAKEQTPWSILLHNNNEILGTLAVEALVVNSDNTDITIKASDIKTVTFEPESLNTVSVKLINGTTITGELQTDKITIQLQPDLKLDVYTVHISEMAYTPPPPKPTPPATQPENPTTTSLTEEEILKIKKELDALQNQLAQREEETKELAAKHQLLVSQGKNNEAAEIAARLEEVKKVAAGYQEKIQELKAKLAQSTSSTKPAATLSPEEKIKIVAELNELTEKLAVKKEMAAEIEQKRQMLLKEGKADEAGQMEAATKKAQDEIAELEKRIAELKAMLGQ